jgi:hypothetical protein
MEKKNNRKAEEEEQKDLTPEELDDISGGVMGGDDPIMLPIFGGSKPGGKCPRLYPGDCCYD